MSVLCEKILLPCNVDITVRNYDEKIRESRKPREPEEGYRVNNWKRKITRMTPNLCYGLLSVTSSHGGGVGVGTPVQREG